jgi:hypothetical protein
MMANESKQASSTPHCPLLKSENCEKCITHRPFPTLIREIGLESVLSILYEQYYRQYDFHGIVNTVEFLQLDGV